MNNCVFCKIVKLETPSQRVYEDDEYIAFLDINPINFGHTLVVPKAHYENVLDVPPEVIAGMIKIAKKVAPAVVEAMRADGFNIGINNGRAAGQLVEHVHIHVIPRFEADNLKSWPSRFRYAGGGMGATAKKSKDMII